MNFKQKIQKTTRILRDLQEFEYETVWSVGMRRKYPEYSSLRPNREFLSHIFFFLFQHFIKQLAFRELLHRSVQSFGFSQLLKRSQTQPNLNRHLSFAGVGAVIQWIHD